MSLLKQLLSGARSVANWTGDLLVGAWDWAGAHPNATATLLTGGVGAVTAHKTRKTMKETQRANQRALDKLSAEMNAPGAQGLRPLAGPAELKGRQTIKRRRGGVQVSGLLSSGSSEDSDPLGGLG